MIWPVNASLTQPQLLQGIGTSSSWYWSCVILCDPCVILCDPCVILCDFVIDPVWSCVILCDCVILHDPV